MDEHRKARSHSSSCAPLAEGCGQWKAWNLKDSPYPGLHVCNLPTSAAVPFAILGSQPTVEIEYIPACRLLRVSTQPHLARPLASVEDGTHKAPSNSHNNLETRPSAALQHCAAGFARVKGGAHTDDLHS
jgi:hypothetical protein